LGLFDLRFGIRLQLVHDKPRLKSMGMRLRTLAGSFTMLVCSPSPDDQVTFEAPAT